MHKLPPAPYFIFLSVLSGAMVWPIHLHMRLP